MQAISPGYGRVRGDLIRLLPILSILAMEAGQAAPPPEVYPDRLVWVFGWNLNQEGDVEAVTQVLETAARHGCSGAMFAGPLDALCKAGPDYLRRLEAVKNVCAAQQLELIPAVFSVGYGSSVLAHDRNLAEGLPVVDAPFVVEGGQGRFVPENAVGLVNGGFEEFTGHKLKGYRFHDEPGEVSWVDREVKRSGQASVRLENFTANPHGHGRVMQELRVRPRRCYRVSLWVKTEDLEPVSGFQISVLAGPRTLAPRSFKLAPTGDWQKLMFLFNSASFESVRIYAGMWGGRSGKLWMDDWAIEEVGPQYVLHRPGTPVTVRSEDGGVPFAEGKDYAPLGDVRLNWRNLERPDASLKILPGSRIQEGQRLRVSWYHPMIIHESQITVCMGEPALYEMFDHEARLLAERLQPRRVMLNMDEIRMGGTCEACRGRNMAGLLGECITRQVEILRRHLPGVEVCIWSDMLDPHHNARGDYYLVEGDFSGAWQHIPKDLTIVVWGGPPREKSLRFFAERGFRTLVACYYDAESLDTVKAWMETARPLPNVRGFMYTPWQKKYELLPAFGGLLREGR